MHSSPVAVHGATGSQGAAAVERLSADGHAVRALSRSTGADLSDLPSLQRAYDGARTVVLQLPLVFDERALLMAYNAAAAASTSGVEHLVINASSQVPPLLTGIPFMDARHLASSATVSTVTVLQPTLYYENITGPWSARSIVDDGVLRSALPATHAAAWVATADVAVAIEHAVVRRVGGWFALPGTPVTGHELTDALAQRLGRPVRWQQVTPEEYGDLLRPHLGDHAADGIIGSYHAILAGLDVPPPDAAPAVAALAWRPRDLSTWLAESPTFTHPNAA
jgi:uncharacterized protein YbjT (DUF2867 family)